MRKFNSSKINTEYGNATVPYKLEMLIKRNMVTTGQIECPLLVEENEPNTDEPIKINP